VKNLGILIDRPGHSQKFRYLTDALNQLPKDINAVVFYCEIGAVPFKTDFPMMDLIHGYSFDGTIISTDIYTTLVMNNMLCPKDRYYYVWDFEHLYAPYSMELLQSVFKNKLLARSKTRFDVLKATWKKPVEILEEFNYEKLAKLVG
jgi:hypothetical protein